MPNHDSPKYPQGEASIPPVVVADDVVPRNDTDGVIIEEDGMEEYTNSYEEDLGTDSYSAREDMLLDKVQSQVYLGGTKFSSLDFLAKLVRIKVKNEWTNSSFDELLGLLRQFESQAQPSTEESFASHPNDVAVSEKVMGDRCGRITGFVHKPSSSTALGSFCEEEEQTSPPQFTREEIHGLVNHPTFKEQLELFMNSYKAPKQGTKMTRKRGM